MIKFQRERAHDLWEEIDPLIKAHYKEIASNQDIPLVPDKKKYEEAEENDILRCYTARIDGRLVGYAVFLVNYNMHYSTSKQALQDILFILKSERKGRLGLGLIKYTEAELESEGVELILHHVKIGHPQLQRLLEKLGYSPVDMVLSKRIGD